MSNIINFGGGAGSQAPKELLGNYKYLSKIDLGEDNISMGQSPVVFITYKNYLISLNNNNSSWNNVSSIYFNIDTGETGKILEISTGERQYWYIKAHGQIGENYYVLGIYDNKEKDEIGVYRITPTLSTGTITTNLSTTALGIGMSRLTQSNLNKTLFFTGADGVNYYSTNGTTWYTAANIPNLYYKNQYIRCEYSSTTSSFTLNFYTNASPIGTNNLEFNELIGSVTINSYYNTNYGLHVIGDKLYFNYNGKTYLVGDDLSSYSEVTYLTSADQIRPNGIISQSTTEWTGVPNEWWIGGEDSSAGVRFNDINYYTQYLSVDMIGSSSQSRAYFGIYQNKYIVAAYGTGNSFYIYKYEMINPY